jgi:tetratricopeptide (TPR) repeat protein
MNTAEPDFDRATVHLQEAISLYPDYAAAWTLLGRVQYRAGNRESAEESLRRSVEIDPKYLGAYGPLARLAVEDKRWDDLLRLSDNMLRINPLFTLGHYYKGGALIKKGDADGAEKALTEALATPDATLFPESHYLLAELYRAQSDVKLAAREYRHYTAAAPPGPTWERARHWLRQWEDHGVIQPLSKKKRRKSNKTE